MANLLDTIQANRQALTAQPAPVEDQTQSVQKLLRAKSGKAVTGSDASISNLGEQQAVQGTNSQLAQLGKQVQLQGQQDQTAAAGIQQQAAQQKQQISQAKQFDTVQNRLQTSAVLSDLSRNKGALDTDKQQAALEQASFLLSMQDKQYTDKLQEIGRQRRLDDASTFQDTMQQMAFGDNINLVKQRLGEGDVLSANDRDYQKAMANMSVDDAKQIAAIEAQHAEAAAQLDSDLTKYKYSQAAKQANQTSMWQGIGGLVSGGMQGASAYQSTPSTISTTPVAAGADTGTSYTGNVS